MNIVRVGLALLSAGIGAGRAASDPARAAAFEANARLAHTINFGNMLEAPQEGVWGLKLEVRFFALAQSAGFTAIRLPIRWNAHAGQAAPYPVDPAFLARVDWAVAQARKRNLTVILDFHHYEELMTDPAEHRARFLGLWAQVAAHYRSQPASVLFEVLNEPNGKVEAVWNELQAQALVVIRRSNPARVVIVGPGGWNSADRLAGLKVPADPNVIVTFHTYTPMTFTHQGADFVQPPLSAGVPWPAGGLMPANGWQNWSW
ncbi:glycoside hydrolase family 5 protein, partial [Deinococcus sp.]|uniref:glycoside hydrolase family 5 protein n=1 Tax=Deinococcus sp. TaxID=47478 RepID=UPI0028699C29